MGVTGKMKKLGWPLLSLLLSACVTINIYFPAAAAEEAARTIVRDVLGEPDAADEQKDEDAVEQQNKQSGLETTGSLILVAGRVLEVLVPVAQAAEPDININTAAISRLRKGMEARQSKLRPYYQGGAIGFDQAGRVAVRDLAAVSLNQRNQMKKLVADENRDRDALYREIARANGHPEWEKDIRKTFSRIWIEEAPAGYWYKSASGSWMKK